MNPEFIMRARRDREFLRILQRADLCLPDGVGVLWAGRVLGCPFKTRVTGVDMTWRLAALAARRGYRVFLLGAAPGVAERTAQVMVKTHPALIVAGIHAGSPSPGEDEAIGELIRAAAPQILLVAYGAPAQDKWIDQPGATSVCRWRWASEARSTSLAASHDAPRRACSRLGLEWLHRLYCDPWRWRRMTALPLFAACVLQQRLGVSQRVGDVK